VSHASSYGTRESSSSNIDAKYVSIQYSDADRATIDAKKKTSANKLDETIKSTCEPPFTAYFRLTCAQYRGSVWNKRERGIIASSRRILERAKEANSAMREVKLRVTILFMSSHFIKTR